MTEDQSAELATLVGHRDQAVVAHTFNPRAKEVETRREMAGQREECKVGGDMSPLQSD